MGCGYQRESEELHLEERLKAEIVNESSSEGDILARNDIVRKILKRVRGWCGSPHFLDINFNDKKL